MKPISRNTLFSGDNPPILREHVPSESGETVDTLTKQPMSGGVENAPGLRHHILSVCGGPTSIYEAGDHGRPTVIMLHGAMYDEARFIGGRLEHRLCCATS